MSPAEVRTHLADAARGLTQQMILWGFDVRHPDGNALIRFGLARGPSTGLQGTSCYSADWEGGQIELHGVVASWTAPPGGCGCVFCRDQRMIFLWDHDQPPVPGQDLRSAGTPLQRWTAFQPLLRWLVGYEGWAVSHLTAGWRDRTWKTIKRLPKGRPWFPPSMALQWWTLALAGAPPRPKTLSSPTA